MKTSLIEKCQCGGILRIKDHGTWIGYFCPKCKCGGSRDKKMHYRPYSTNAYLHWK
jgi:hypothetical protein